MNCFELFYCFQRFKDTKKKANHNAVEGVTIQQVTVFNDSKILKRKLITTDIRGRSQGTRLFSTIQRY